MKRNRLRIFAVIMALCMSLLCCPVAVAATDISTFSTIPYVSITTLQIGQRVSITGTPNYSAATNNASTNFFGFDTTEGVWYIAIGSTSVEAFKAAMPSQKITLYGMYAGTLDVNGMPILDIQQGAVQSDTGLSETSDLNASGQSVLAEAAKEKAEKTSIQMVWITRTGKKYHSIPNCGRTKESSSVSIQEAQKRGYGPCNNCYKE